MKNIILTGASKGLGFEIAKVLLENGNRVYAINRTIPKGLGMLQKTYPDNLLILKFDLKNSNSVRDEVFKKFIGLKTPLHGFINNAAIAYDDIVTNLSLERLQEMYAINVFSPMNFTKYVLRQMLLHNTKGSIVHISSISVHTGYKGLTMYASTKGALEAFSKNTAREWGGKGIRSNAIVAGFMETNMSGTISEDQKNRIYGRTALKKATSKTSVAKTVDFLLSDQAESITGQSIFVDSGTI